MNNDPDFDHISPDAATYARIYLGLMPQGAAWPKSLTSLLGRMVVGLCGVIARFDERAMSLLRNEADPRSALFTLPAWERQVGLPDECTPVGATLEERRALVTARWTAQGGASRAYFTDIARRLGYEITIEETEVGIFGISEFGVMHFGPPQMRFWWRVRVPGPRLSFARFADWEFGVQPHLTIRRAEDLECLFNKLKPAHTKILFLYEGI